MPTHASPLPLPSFSIEMSNICNTCHYRAEPTECTQQRAGESLVLQCTRCHTAQYACSKWQHPHGSSTMKPYGCFKCTRYEYVPAGEIGKSCAARCGSRLVVKGSCPGCGDLGLCMVCHGLDLWPRATRADVKWQLGRSHYQREQHLYEVWGATTIDDLTRADVVLESPWCRCQVRTFRDREAFREDLLREKQVGLQFCEVPFTLPG